MSGHFDSDEDLGINRSIFDNSLDAILITKPDGSVFYANHAAQELFGYTQKEICELGRERLVDTEDRNLSVMLEEIANTGKTKGELTLIKKDGSKFPALLSTNIFYDKNENEYNFIIIRDITKRKQMEREIIQKQTEIQTLFDNTPAGMVLFDAKPPYTVLVHNKYYQELFTEPFRTNGMVGLNVYDYAPEVEAAGVVAVFDEVVKTKKAKNFLDFPYNSNPPNETWFNWHMSPIIVDDEVIALVSMSIDVTDRHVVEQALQESLQRFRTVADFTIDWEYWIDPKGNFIYVSLSCERITGYKPDEFEKNPNLILEIIHPDDQEVFKDHLQSELTAEKPISMEFRIIDKNGEERWITHICQPVYDNKGVFLGRRASNRDDTDRKLAEQQIEYHSLLLGKVIDAIIGVDFDFRINYWNKGAEQMFGYTESEVQGKTPLELLRPTYAPGEREEILNELNIKGASKVTINIKHKKGTEIIAEVHSTRIKDESGSTIGYVIVYHDITERKQAEEKINRRGKLLNGINTVLQEAFKVDTVEEVANKCLETAEELTKSEFGFIGEINANGHFDDIALSPPAWEACKAAPQKAHELIKDMEIASYWGRVLIKGNSQIVNDPDSDPDRRGVPEGHPQITSFLGVPLKQSGQTIGMIALANKKEGYTSEDQTNIEVISDVMVEAMMRKRAEIQLKYTLHDLEGIVDERTQDLLLAYKYNRNLIETALDPLVTIGPDGKITDVNKATEKATGFSREELIGTDFADYFTKPEKAKEGYQKVLKEGEVRDYPLEIRHKDGSTTPVLYNASVYKDEFGEVIGVFAAARDITERKKAEQAIREYWESLEEQVELRTEELAKSNADLKQFAYVASHDLREPLRMITSFLQLLERRYNDQLDEDANEFIGFAVDGAKRLDTMIMDLLEYSRVANKEMLYIDVDIQEVIEQVISNLNFLIDENSAQITYDSLPSIRADESQMIRLFQNLIENAIKYRREETPKISVSANKQDRNFVFNVKDNGIGIDTQHLERIFTIFKRLHTHEEYEGTGIGLALAQRIVHQHGGEIWAESQPGNGSTFYFTIPSQ